MDDPKVFFPIECNEINSEIIQCAAVAWLGVVAAAWGPFNDYVDKKRW